MNDHNWAMQASSPIAETDGSIATSGQVVLDHLGVIRAAGADSAKFLHGQLTQDVSGLTADASRLAGYCSAKGRLLATFAMWRPEPDLVLLACSADLLAPTLKRLSMFVLRAQCKLSDASREFSLLALFGPAAVEALGARAPQVPWARAEIDGATVIRLPAADGAALFLVARPVVDGQPQGLAEELAAIPQAPVAAWHLHAVRAGIPWVTAATSEQFVPQMVNLELVGGVNFQKGCYPGQEVVARSQYRGTLKRRMQLFTVSADALPGQEIVHSEDPGQPAGKVVNAAAQAEQRWLLAEVKLAALTSGTLHLVSADGPVLHRAALPYAMPQDAAEAASA
jgi:tRNA-modifying protein YgfZ